jgi:hypothetical protein
MQDSLRQMEFTVRSLNDLLSVIKEDDYLVVEHKVYGHVTELHPEDFSNHKEILIDALNYVSEKNNVPW